MCDKKHAKKHQVKEDQTHMPLPPEGTSHAILLVPSACVKVLRLHMAMAKKQSEYIPQKPHVKVHYTSCHTPYKLTTAGKKSDIALKWGRWNM